MDETGASRALLVNGSADGKPRTGIGTTTGAGSWYVLDASNPLKRPNGWRTLWRDADGDLWFQPARFGSIAGWFPKHTGNWWLDGLADLAATRYALVVPWDSSWPEPGGTQGQSADNGVIVLLTADGKLRYEIQGMAPLGPVGATAVNVRTFFSGLPLSSHYRCDAVWYSGAGVPPRGSQGPISKLDGLLRPSYLAGPPAPGAPPLRLSVFNVAYGAATPAAGGWTEHPGLTAPYPELGTRPSGNDPTMVPCYQGFRLEITDDAIERWLTDEKATGPLLLSKRQFAVNLRGDGKRPTIKCAESGTYSFFLESSGNSERAAWAERGVTSEADANALGHNLFKYGRLVDAV